MCIEAVESKAKRQKSAANVFDLSLQRSHSCRKPAVCLFHLYRTIYIVFGSAGALFSNLHCAFQYTGSMVRNSNRSTRRRQTASQPYKRTRTCLISIWNAAIATKTIFSIKSSLSTCLVVIVCFPRADRCSCYWCRWWWCCCCCNLFPFKFTTCKIKHICQRKGTEVLFLKFTLPNFTPSFLFCSSCDRILCFLSGLFPPFFRFNCFW